MWKLVVTLLVTLAAARPLHERTLVVHDSSNNAVPADMVADPLRARGHVVDVEAVKSGPAMFADGVRLYDNVVIIPGRSKGLGKDLSARRILDFLADGGNILALTTPEYSPTSLREAAGQLGIHVGTRGTVLVDHFSSKAGHVDGSRRIALSEASFANPAIVAYNPGVASSVVNSSAAIINYAENELVFPLVRAPSSAYAYNALSEEDEQLSTAFALGSEALLAAAIQTRANSRFTWVGSSDVLLDSYGTEISKWTFQEVGALRASDVVHYDPRDGRSHHVYKVSEPLAYCATLSEWDGEDWKPYVADDIQLEFRMLDPYYRLDLHPQADGRYCREFQIPDQHGMFTLSLDYARHGKSFVSDKRVVTIRHTANDEWPRSWTITNSWVYLSSAGAVAVAWLVFVAMYLGIEEPKQAVRKQAVSKTGAPKN